MQARKSDAYKVLANKIKEINNGNNECREFFVLNKNKKLEEAVLDAMVEYAQYIKDQETKRREQ